MIDHALPARVERGCGLWDIVAGMAICEEAGLVVGAEEFAPGRWAIDARC